MSLLLRCALLASLFSATVLADSVFKNPPPPPARYDATKNKRYQLGQQIDVQWESDFLEVDVLLFPIWAGPGVNITGNDFERVAAKSKLNSVSWQASFGYIKTNLKPGEDAVFHFSLYKPGQTSWDSTTSNFNITNTQFKGTTTSAAPQSTTSATRSDDGSTTNSVISTATSSSTAAPASTSHPDKSKGLSTGAVAGIAVGATLGGLLLVGLLGFFAWKRFRRPAAAPAAAPDSQVSPRSELESKPAPTYTSQTYNYHPVPNYQAPPQPQYNPSPGLYEAP